MHFVPLWLFGIGHIWHYVSANSGHQLLAEQAKALPVAPVASQPVPAFVASAGGFAAALPSDPQQFYQPGSVMAAPLMILGSPCVDNFTCAALPNSYCGNNRTCQCMTNFIEDPIFTGTCRLAPGYNELCASGETECRQPFVCNATNMCDCKPGFLQEYFQCVKDCPFGQVPVGENCMQARQLEEKCETNEQCMQAYSQCLHNKCQCIPGTNQHDGHCHPVNQCPLGEPAKDKRGKVQTCAGDNEEVCAKDFYCLHAEVGSQSGVCCPKTKMNCPIGQPLEGHNCTNCPWETHHCFSYVIGTFTETMCCPNACPAGHPIQKDGKCYAKSAYRGHCMVDEQCYSVLGASCRKDKDGKTRCMCPDGNFRNYYGRCLRDAGLGEDCTANEECRPGSNTLCSNGICTCFNGYIPEPIKGRSPAASVSNAAAPQRCIAEPSCPTPSGLKPMEAYTECTEDGKSCKENEFCRRWWNDANHTYSLCCAKAKISDYEAMCKPFRMKLLATPKKTEPQRCDISALPQQQFYVAHDAAGNASAPVLCPPGASCLFDPYSMDKGICCNPDDSAIGAAAPVSRNPGAPVAPITSNASAAIAAGAPAAIAPAVANNRGTTASPSGLPAFGGARPIHPVAAGATNASIPTPPANNTTPKVDESEEEEEQGAPHPIGERAPAPAPTTAAPGLSGARTTAASAQANQSSRLPGSATNNIPIVRIRGFNNNHQQG